MTTLHSPFFGDFSLANDQPLAFFAGPCAIESASHALETAMALREIFRKAGMPFVYKSSFDKANRSSGASYRGPGLARGLEVLGRVKEEAGVPVVTDVHEPAQCAPAAEVCDVLQLPAFLCRQTDLIAAACSQGRPVNIKKGQFLAPWDMKNVLDKAHAAGCRDVLLCERGSSFGYGNLVVDMRGLGIFKSVGAPAVFDATHSVQLPGAGGACSGGDRRFVPLLARAAAAVGIACIFMEVHEDPDRAPCDGPNMLAIRDLPPLLDTLKAIDRAVKQDGTLASERLL